MTEAFSFTDIKAKMPSARRLSVTNPRPALNRINRIANSPFSSVDGNAALFASAKTKQRFGKFSFASPEKTTNSDNFSAPNVEIDVMKDVLDGKPPHRHYDVGAGLPTLNVEGIDITTNHLLNERCFAQLADDMSTDDLAVLHDGYAIAKSPSLHRENGIHK